jgi:hypothetical protein
MVWVRMGLLDEAIREHLELKRRRGADPSAVAREERSALAPALEEAPEAKHGLGDGVHQELEDSNVGDTESTHAPHHAWEQPTEAHAVSPAEDLQHAPAPEDAPPAHQDSVERLTIGQETAELDMEAIIAEWGDAPQSGQVKHAAVRAPDWGFEGEVGGANGASGVPERGHFSLE